MGKLLGPKGNSMKRLQEETMTKMAVLGRGSMRDKQKVSTKCYEQWNNGNNSLAVLLLISSVDLNLNFMILEVRFLSRNNFLSKNLKDPHPLTLKTIF